MIYYNILCLYGQIYCIYLYQCIVHTQDIMLMLFTAEWQIGWFGIYIISITVFIILTHHCMNTFNTYPYKFNTNNTCTKLQGSNLLCTLPQTQRMLLTTGNTCNNETIVYVRIFPQYTDHSPGGRWFWCACPVWQGDTSPGCRRLSLAVHSGRIRYRHSLQAQR